MLNKKFWNEYSKVYNLACLFIPYQELLEEICEQLEIQPGEKILEAGCGTGNLAFKIQERGAEVVGLDNSEDFLRICQEKHPEIKTVCADLRERFAFSDESFDKIVSNNTLYALSSEKQLATLKEFYRILKPGGRLAIVNSGKEFSSIKIFLDHLKKDIKRNGFIAGLKNIFKINLISLYKMARFNFQIEEQGFFFTEQEQKELLEKLGFRQVETRLVYADQAILISAIK